MPTSATPTTSPNPQTDVLGSHSSCTSRSRFGHWTTQFHRTNSGSLIEMQWQAMTPWLLRPQKPQLHNAAESVVETIARTQLLRWRQWVHRTVCLILCEPPWPDQRLRRLQVQRVWLFVAAHLCCVASWRTMLRLQSRSPLQQVLTSCGWNKFLPKSLQCFVHCPSLEQLRIAKESDRVALPQQSAQVSREEKNAWQHTLHQ